MTRFADLNPRMMPGYGDPETWGGRSPYGEAPDWTDADDEWMALADMIDREPERDHEGHLAQSEPEPYLMCECELDWNCPLHQGQYTAIERMNDRWASEQSEIDRMHGM